MEPLPLLLRAKCLVLGEGPWRGLRDALLHTDRGLVGDAAVGKTALVSVFDSHGSRFPKAYNMVRRADAHLLGRLNPVCARA